MSQKVNLNAYFERIGFAGSIAPTLATLELICGLHPAVIPFENLSPLLGQPVNLDLASISKKLLNERRGGYCYEHNLLLMAVLQELDYSVRTLAARVLWSNPEGASAPANHMLLAVDISGTTYIADPGFGGLALTAPLRLKHEAEQPTPHETYRLLKADNSWQLEAKIDEEWKALYIFEMSEIDPAAYAASNLWLSSDAASPFTQQMRVALSPSGKRLALHNNRYTIYAAGLVPERRALESVAAIRTVLTEDFGLQLPSADLLDPKLEVILANAGVADI